MRSSGRDDVVPFHRTVGPLALAPLAGIAVLTGITLRHAGPNALAIAPYLAWRMAAFCYVAAVLLVLPIVAIWPQVRNPRYVVAAIWGAMTADAAAELLTWSTGQSLLGTMHADGLLMFGAAGAASGLLYALSVKRGGGAGDVVASGVGPSGAQ